MQLSVEEIVRQHASRRVTKQENLDSDLRRLKGLHLKQRGDEALKADNYREAWERYSEAISLHLDKDTLRLLHSNRSLAYAKARRFDDALQDAEEAVKLAPRWSKGHWRRGAALLGLKRAPEAVAAYKEAWALSDYDAEVESKLWHVVQRLTREQLGEGILTLFKGLEEQGRMEPARKEQVSQQEQVEALFRIIKAEHHLAPRPGVYYTRYLSWLKGGMPVWEAYTQRSRMYKEAKCYLQARADALAGVAAVAQQIQDSGSSQDRRYMALLCEAYRCMGDAYMAEKDHEDRDCRGAAKAYAKAMDVDPDNEAAREGLKQAGEHLTKEQLEQIAVEVYNEGALVAGGGLANPAALGFVDVPKPGERVFRVEISLAFPQAKPAALNSRAREVLRLSLASHAQLGPLRVSIERVLAPSASRPWLAVAVHAQAGGDVLKANALVQVVKGSDTLLRAIGGEELICHLGPPDPAHCSAEIVDITPTFASGADQQEGGGNPEDKQLTVPARPKLDLELPYKLYKLVRGDGTLVERADKHPFCMSRVYYSAVEKPEEVWTELGDGSCRWRQTGSEIKIMVLRVPQNVPPKQLAVTIEPLFLKVCNRSTGEVYLEGELERGVVPEDCFWTHCQGKDEDGCMVTLHKMNLELLQRHWLHHEMWWPRLFKHHGEIAWDDYEKDYSDLPEVVLRRHRYVSYGVVRSLGLRLGAMQTCQMRAVLRQVCTEASEIGTVGWDCAKVPRRHWCMELKQKWRIGKRIALGSM